MDHVVLMSEVKGNYQLDRESTHYRVGNHVVLEPYAKTPECLSHELVDKAYVSPVWSLNLKVVDEMAHVFVAHQSLVTVSQMP